MVYLLLTSDSVRSYKMTIEYLEDTYGTPVVFITNEDGTTLSMSKAEYDRRQAEQSTPNLTV
jgi:hypothetical protein